MTENNGNPSSSVLMFVFVAIALVVAFTVVFGLGGDDPEESSASSSTSPLIAPSGGPPSIPSRLDPSGSDEITEAGREGTSSPPSPPSSPVRPGELAPMPAQVAEDFARGTAPISEEKLAEMQRGMNEMPEHIRREFEGAGSRPMPPEVERAFENPYPTIPAEELEMLRENGRNPGAK